MKGRIRRAVVRAACFLGGLFASSVGAGLAVIPEQPGNIFLPGERVAIPVTGDGDSIAWVIRDFHDREVARGIQPLREGRAMLLPKLGSLGYFSLHLTDRRLALSIGRLKSSFAIIPPPPTPAPGRSRFGVQTHFAQGRDPGAMTLMRRAGIGHFRDEHYWDKIEVERGKYEFPPSFTSFMSKAEQAGLEPLITLNWANPFYDSEAGQFTAPHTDAGRAGFAAYAGAVLDRYGAQLRQVEVWNEYNGGTFTQGPAAADKPRHYVEMLRRVTEIVRARHPEVKIVAGTAVPVAHGFLRDIFTLGALPLLDVVSIHPYIRYPEGTELEIEGLNNLIAKFNDGQAKPVWATEFSMNCPSDADQPHAASYLARIVVQLLNAGVERMFFYLLEDDTLFPSRGLVGKASSPAGRHVPNPAYVAYASVIRELDGWTAQGRIRTATPTTYIYRFAQGEATRHVVWATAPTALEFMGTGKLRATDLMGNKVAETTQGKLRLRDVGLDALFIEGTVARIEEASNAILADALASYGDQQGEGGWSYGEAVVPPGASYQPESFRPLKWGIWRADNYRWLGASDTLYIAGPTMHPSAARAVRRWTSPADEVVKITGTISRGAGGDGVGVQILADGAVLAEFTIGSDQSQIYEVKEVNLPRGAVLDFTVDQQGNDSFDATEFTARIEISGGGSRWRAPPGKNRSRP